MLRQLANNQEELKDVNDNLNVKVDELAQANMRLYEMNRLKSDFLATMSHELRTPLNSIIGFSDVLESIASLDDKQKRYVRNIQTSGKMLLEMINDILDLAKIESGKMEVRLSDFRIDHGDYGPVRHGPAADGAQEHRPRKPIEPDLPEMFQDQAKVQQILNNLLSNAIKFTPEGGRIVISAQRGDPSQLLLQVADTGRGHRRGRPGRDLRKIPPGQIGAHRRRRHDPRILRHGPGAVDRQGAVQAAGRRNLAWKASWAKGSTFTVRLPWTRADQPRLESRWPPGSKTSSSRAAPTFRTARIWPRRPARLESRLFGKKRGVPAIFADFSTMGRHGITFRHPIQRSRTVHRRRLQRQSRTGRLGLHPQASGLE